MYYVECTNVEYQWYWSFKKNSNTGRYGTLYHASLHESLISNQWNGADVNVSFTVLATSLFHLCLSGCPSQHAYYTAGSRLNVLHTHPITHSILPLTCMKLAQHWCCLCCLCWHASHPSLCHFLSRPLPLSVVSLHSVFEHDRLLRAARYQVTADRWQAVDSFKHFSHLGDRVVHLAPALRSSGQAGQDQRLDSSQQ